MERREFLKYGAAGLATAGLGLSPAEALAQAACKPTLVGRAVSPTSRFQMAIADVRTRLVDGKSVNQIGFSLVAGYGPLGATPAAAARVPGPVLRVREGTPVQITIQNNRPEWHGFQINGVAGTRTEIAPGCSVTITFTAPAAGTYIYHDAFGTTPLYRLLGLHGVLVVEPAYGTTAAKSRTPYSLNGLTPAQRQPITALFDALGMTDRFQGGVAGKWVPAPLNAEYSNQEKIWVLSQVDPRFNALVTPGQPIKSAPALTANVVENFQPRYFTINNRSGYDLHRGDDVVIRNYIGEPTLIRAVNVGLCHHATHIHGNHPMNLAHVEHPDLYDGSPNYGRMTVCDNIYEVDTWAMWPMQRNDLLLPLEAPPDIPYDVPVLGGRRSQWTRMVNGQAQEPFPLRYVMHCHCEMSQTASGGNYPQGMVTHWEILGGVGGRAKLSGIGTTTSRT
jgi:hypothetical protein